jgi:hypothetical protein
MTTPYLSAQSVEWVRASVTATQDPTAATVSFGFDTDDTPDTWHPGEWEGVAERSGDYWTATARVLVGPGFVPLPSGRVLVWIRAAASPEDVIKPIGSLKVS